jgi:hypothetical protein
LEALQQLATEFAITITSPDFWLSIGNALILGAGCLAVGVWVARTVGLLRSNAPAGETLGVGLATGSMVLAAAWATIWSGGRSSFTPVAVGFAIAIVLGLAKRSRRRNTGNAHTSRTPPGEADAHPPRPRAYRSVIYGALACAVFVAGVASLYGSTVAPSPRDGVQPVENRDEAFYAILGRDLATTGTETNALPSGFAAVPGAPAQIWYHWGELWLAGAVITIFGTTPMAARYFIVLPILLLAAAALTGTLVRCMARTNSRRAFIFGTLACLFLAPVPLVPGPFFSSWAAGLIFGITLYGLAAVAVLLVLYALTVIGERTGSWSLAAFVASAVASILPSHVAIAVLALVGTGTVFTIRTVRSLVAQRRLPIVSGTWVGVLVATAAALTMTVAWGLLTGHALGSSSSPSGSPPSGVVPFNPTWRASVAITFLGGGAFFAIPIVWFLRRKTRPVEEALYLGTAALVIGGALAWGARLGDFTMFYLFFAGIAVIATPIAAVAVRILWERLRSNRHAGLAAALVALCVVQLALGVPGAFARLRLFGPTEDGPLTVGLLEAISRLPPDAVLAYSCTPFSEVAFGTPQLLSIDAHAGRRVVPMCFEAELPNTLLGVEPSLDVMSQFFRGAPQFALYPDVKSVPPPAAVLAFMKEHGLGYIYVDPKHPNSLVDAAIPIAKSGAARVLKVP